MALWSTKRRFIYGGSTILVLAIIFTAVFFGLVYKTPTCFDGARNGDETGVDCGGSCVNLCINENLAPVVLWSKTFNISGDVYSAVAYVENPNINSKNSSAQYEFKIYDSNNNLILTKEGQTSIPKNKKFAIFETGLVIKNNKPRTVDFKFTSFEKWEKDLEKDLDIELSYGTLLSTTTSPRIVGTITNDSLKTVPQSELSVFILDGKENVVAASRTFVDNLTPRSSQDFVFTWPKAFDLGVEVCINPVDVVLALDKSGSMRSESSDPPEPFTTVLSTAKEFVNNLAPEDQVGIVSFGDNSKQESSLSLTKQDAVLGIDGIFFNRAINEQTNIAGGLTDSLNELLSDRARPESKKVIILLTDGIPTMPKMPNTPDFPAFSARQVSKNINSNKVALYTIGLGKDADGNFLKSITNEDGQYFFAPTKADLGSIYEKISSSLCERKPNVINVIHRAI